MVNLKYDLWEKGIDFEYFHATEDTQHTRNQVFEIISANLANFVVDSVIVEKCKTHPTLQEHQKFYQKTFEFLLDYILKRYKEQFQSIFILTDVIPVKKRRADVAKAIKRYISGWASANNGTYTIQHYSSKSDINLQIVDYFNWAIFRKWERDDERSYDIIKEAVKSKFDVFKRGRINYYERKK